MSVEIKGVDALIKKLGMVAAQNTLDAPMQRSLFRVQRRMQEYPPALPPRQGPSSQPVRFTTRAGRSVDFIAKAPKPYRRTGTYGRRWTTRVLRAGDGLQGRVGNNTRYAPYVGSERFQARVHRGRWNTDAGVLRQETPAITADFQQAIDRALAE